MSRPALPSYASPENSAFHPVFKRAMEEVLNSRGLAAEVTIRGQYPSPTGPIDFVLVDNNTNKVIFPIEIKRTQSDVRGLGRRQGRDYWVNLGAGCQTLFYCVSNLELTELFRSDASRPRTSAQRLHLSKSIAGELGVTSENDFYTGLISCLEEVLDVVYGHKSHTYFVGLTQFQAHVESAIGDHNRWHKIFVPACFEYIRGASTNISNLRALTSSWRAASFYSATPNRLNVLGGSVDFKHIFSAPPPDVADPSAFMPAVLVEAYECGKALGRGDDIAELVNEVLKPNGPGIVETDAELGQLLGIVARVSLGRALNIDEEVFEPSCGSGRLLTVLPLVAFPGLTPRQVRANEIEPLFAESLSLRLGLAFGNVVTPTNAPTITIKGIESITQAELIKVRVVVMNPPFLSGVQASNIKGAFANRIRSISGVVSELNSGQIALEALFLELVWNLVPNDTVIATVFPVQHLHRLSDEVAKLRRFLAQKFALSHIVIYPSAGVFEGVTKQTILLVGRKGFSGANVKLVEVQKKVSEVDFTELAANLPLGGVNPTHGVSVTSVSRASLVASADEGWKKVIGAGVRVDAFLQTYMPTYLRLGDLPSGSVRRGTVGNKGNTKLTVFNPGNPQLPSVTNLMPASWQRPILNTTDSMPRILTPTTAPEKAIYPPPNAYLAGTSEHLVLQQIVAEYIVNRPPPSGVQAVVVKDAPTIIKDLKSDQKDLGLGWVLIQRASRTKGEICLLEHGGILLSTNVHMVKLPSLRERKLLASWLLSVFGQLQLELNSTPQEGMRKLELGGVKKVVYPDFSTIPAAIEAQLIASLATEPAIDFANIAPRPSDYKWAEVVNPTDPTDCLNNAFLRYQDLVDERRGF